MTGSKHGRPQRGTAMSAMAKAVTPNKKHRKQTKPSSISQSTETIVEIDTDNFTASTTTTPVVTNAASETPPLAQDMEVDDEASTDTVQATNSTEATVSHSFCTFVQLRCKVEASKQGTETMRKRFMKILTCLQEADPDVACSPFKTNKTKDSQGNILSLKKDMIEKSKDIPSSITKIGKFFFGSRPNSKGGMIWTQLRLVHNVDIETIIADTEAEFRDDTLQSNLTINSVQHWNVAHLGFLKNLHPDVDAKSLSTYLTETIEKNLPGTHIEVGLRARAPFDGKKKVGQSIPFSRNKHSMAMHVDVAGEQEKVAKDQIKKIFASPSFKERYNCMVRLVPLYDRRGSTYTNEKIVKCIIQHGQFTKSITAADCEDVDYLDVRNVTLDKTLRQLILSLPNSHFINIDQKWNKSGFQILFPTKYEDNAKNMAAHLGTYLHRQHGDAILPSLSVNTQEKIHNTLWDSDLNRPVSKLDQELDGFLEEGDNLEFVDISLLTDSTPSRPIISPSATFTPQLDTNSVSTFGARVHSQPSPYLTQPNPPTETDQNTAMSGLTIESRMTTVEDGIQSMNQLLLALVAQGQQVPLRSTGPIGTLSSAESPPTQAGVSAPAV